MCPSFAGSFVSYTLRSSFKQEDIKNSTAIDERSRSSLQLEFFRANLLSATPESKGDPNRDRNRLDEIIKRES